MSRLASDLGVVCGRFALPGPILRAEVLGGGHIHDTFVVVSGAGGEQRWVLQRLNDRVFPDIVGLMENVGRVTRHLQARAAGPRQLSHGHHFFSGRPTASRIRS